MQLSAIATARTGADPLVAKADLIRAFSGRATRYARRVARNPFQARSPPAPGPIRGTRLPRCELFGATEQEAQARLKLFLAPLPTEPPIGIYPGERGVSGRDIIPAPRSFPGKIDVEQNDEWHTGNTIWFACLASVMSLLSI